MEMCRVLLNYKCIFYNYLSDINKMFTYNLTSLNRMTVKKVLNYLQTNIIIFYTKVIKKMIL
jgi:hypothetical protein